MSLVSRLFRRPPPAPKAEPLPATPAKSAKPVSPAAGIGLVVWDLDDIFWQGTLTEDEVALRPQTASLVTALAGHGVRSTICARTDADEAMAMLVRAGIWEQFQAPSIAWSAPGPRLAGVLAASGVTPADAIFISASPARRAEAELALPGLRSAGPDILDGMTEAGEATLAGLAEYHSDHVRPVASQPGRTIDFLRASAITVTIEPDVTAHLDRALALIANTTAFNFTKSRPRTNHVRAMAVLRDALASPSVQAGLVRVRDAYADYGFCGLYFIRRTPRGRRLVQFCFSARTAGMGVETWLYNRLGRPEVEIEEPVSTDILKAAVPDWISFALPDGTATESLFDTLFTRGAGATQRVAAHIRMLARDTRIDPGGVVSHSVLARYAIEGIEPAILDAMVPLGFSAEDFTSAVTSLPPSGRDIWLLGFGQDAQPVLWRHRSTGAVIPIRAPRNRPDSPLSDEDAERRRALRLNYEPIGLIDEARFKANVAALLDLAPPSTRVFVLVPPESEAEAEGMNAWMAASVAAYPHMTLLRMEDFLPESVGPGTQQGPDRMTYVRVAEHIVARCLEPMG